MKLRNKALLFLAASFALFLLLLAGLAHLILLPRAAEGEAQLMEVNLLRVNAKIEDRLGKIHRMVAQWSSWDDTLEFVGDHNPKYVEDNFNAQSLGSLGLHLLVFWDAKGKFVDGRLHDPASGKFSAVPDGLRRELETIPGFPLGTETSQLKGLFPTTQGIFLTDQVGTLPYQNVRIENNLLYVYDGYNGIMVGNGRNVEIIGNSVLSESRDNQKFWIRLDRVEGVTLRNNIADSFVNQNNKGMTTENNIFLDARPSVGGRIRDLQALAGATAAGLVIPGVGYQPPTR